MSARELMKTWVRLFVEDEIRRQNRDVSVMSVLDYIASLLACSCDEIKERVNDPSVKEELKALIPEIIKKMYRKKKRKKNQATA